MKVLAALALLALIFAVGGCGDGSGEPAGFTAPSPVGQVLELTERTEPTEPASPDEERIREVSNQVATAIADEDWGAFYDVLAPSVRKWCTRGGFRAMMAGAVALGKELVGEDAYQAALGNLEDGYEIQGIVITGDDAVVVAPEIPDGIALVRRGGDWWYVKAVRDEPLCP